MMTILSRFYVSATFYSFLRELPNFRIVPQCIEIIIYILLQICLEVNQIKRFQMRISRMTSAPGLRTNRQTLIIFGRNVYRKLT